LGKDEVGHLLRLVDLDIVAGAGNQEQFRGWEQLVEATGDPLFR
jgi:hypothetical protein